MRRRTRNDAPNVIPARLQHYDPRDWTNPKCHPECAYWAAVDEWRESEPQDDERPIVLFAGPDVPWHDEWT